MKQVFCLNCWNVGTVSHNEVMGTHDLLEVVNVDDNPTVTDEFPEGAHTKQVADIKERREQRNAFWNAQSFYGQETSFNTRSVWSVKHAHWRYPNAKQ
jgi:hypothetical protein